MDSDHALIPQGLSPRSCLLTFRHEQSRALTQARVVTQSDSERICGDSPPELRIQK